MSLHVKHYKDTPYIISIYVCVIMCVCVCVCLGVCMYVVMYGCRCVCAPITSSPSCIIKCCVRVWRCVGLTVSGARVMNFSLFYHLHPYCVCPRLPHQPQVACPPSTTLSLCRCSALYRPHHPWPFQSMCISQRDRALPPYRNLMIHFNICVSLGPFMIHDYGFNYPTV